MTILQFDSILEIIVVSIFLSVHLGLLINVLLEFFDKEKIK